MKSDSASATKKSGIGRLLEIADEKRGLLAGACVLSVASTFLMFVPYVAVYYIAAELLKNAAAPSANDMEIIRLWGWRALWSLPAALLLLYGGIMASHVAAFRTLYAIRMRLARHLAALPLGYHTRGSSGAVKKTLEWSVEKIENFIAHQLPDLVGAIVFPAVLLAGMFTLDWRLALACFIPLASVYVFQYMVFYGPGAKMAVGEYHNALEKMNAAGIEFVRGMPAVKVFGLTVDTFFRFHASIMEYRNWAVEYTRFCKRPYILFTTVLASLLAFILPVGVLLLSGRPHDAALALTLTLFLVLAPGVSTPVLKLMYLGGTMRLISEGVKRIDAILEVEPTSEPDAPKIPSSFSVEFRDVSFSYEEKEAAVRKEALSGVSFVAKEGGITALVGPSGGGKSTIASLIPRFWDAESGGIAIGGVDVRAMGTERLMKTVSFVFQDVHLFHDTVEENIRMGRGDIAFDEVVAAAKAACCHDFIDAMPDGYRTVVGEGGVRLSGGEAQRVAIARAILKNAPVLVLDEATAFADPENESRIQEGLSALMRGKTVIVIAHRLSSIRDADKIVVVDGGRIAQQGKWDELTMSEGVFKRLWLAYEEASAWTLGRDLEREEATA